MAESLGPVRYSAPAGACYLGPLPGMRQITPDTEMMIDTEIRAIVEGAEKQALDMLETYSAALEQIAQVHMEREVIDGDEVDRIVEDPSAA